MEKLFSKLEKAVYWGINYTLFYGVLLILKHFCGWELTVLSGLAYIVATQETK